MHGKSSRLTEAPGSFERGESESGGASSSKGNARDGNVAAPWRVPDSEQRPYFRDVGRGESGGEAGRAEAKVREAC
eukprot:3554198-Prymnesium_polylepis.1